jgi:hypothetical protein
MLKNLHRAVAARPFIAANSMHRNWAGTGILSQGPKAARPRLEYLRLWPRRGL